MIFIDFLVFRKLIVSLKYCSIGYKWGQQWKIPNEFATISVSDYKLEWMEIEAKKQRVFATSLGRRLLSAIFQLRAGYNLLISVHVTECPSDSFRAVALPAGWHLSLLRTIRTMPSSSCAASSASASMQIRAATSNSSLVQLTMLTTGEALQMQQSAVRVQIEFTIFLSTFIIFHPCSSIFLHMFPIFFHLPKSSPGCWCCPASWASSAPWSAAMKRPSRSSACRQLGNGWATDGPAARALGIWGFSGGNSVKVWVYAS